MTRRPVVQSTPALLARIAAQDAKNTPTRIPLPPVVKPSKEEEQAESELQSDCRSILSHRGVEFVFHMANPRGNPIGVPDHMFAYMPRADNRAIPCAAEYKVGKNTMTPDQVRVSEEMQRGGWRFREIRSVPQFKAWLDEMEQDAIPAAVAGPGSLAGQKTGADMGSTQNASCAKLEGEQ